jgi:hypothetical protein
MLFKKGADRSLYYKYLEIKNIPIRETELGEE